MSTIIAEGFELSPQQKHLWALQQAEQEQPYRAHCAVLIEGQIDVAVLSTALRNVFKRHEILHTTFGYLPGMKLPLQVVNGTELLLNDDSDLTGLSSREQEAHLTALLLQTKQLSFNFERGPLAYASLVRLSSSRQILLLSLGALCVDSIALDNLVGELSLCYTACLQNVELSDEPIQYSVAAQYLNEVLESDDAEIGRQYWRKQSVSDPLIVRLPFENLSRAISSFQPEVVTAAVDAGLLARIKTLARTDGVSVSSVLLAGWQILLKRLTGLSDLTVGLSCDGRTDDELNGVVGLFARNVPLQTHLSRGSTFREVAQRSDESAREAYAWQDCFSWKHLGESNSSLSPQQFFPYCFEFVERPRTYAAAGVSFSMYERYTCLDRFKVKLSCAENNDSLIAEVHYDSNLFAREDMQRLSGNFLTLIESALKAPDTVIDRLPVLSRHEREQLSIEFNATSITYPESNVTQLFEPQVERTPDSVAVVFENRQLTYADLNSQANQLAHYLRRLGVGPGVLVALCIDRSIEMVVGLLGILKAGGAYLPLDPNYPIERLTFMLQDAQAPVLLTQERLLNTLKDTAAQIICVDAERKTLANESSESPVNVASASDLAYVIYTSGSTNRPKGVMIPHGAISNHMFWFNAAFSVGDRDVVLQKTPFSFDASVWEFYAPLLTGGRLIMALPGGQQDSAYLVQVMIEQQVTLLQVVPSLLRLLLTEARLAACDCLRFVFAGGEALPLELQQKFSSRLNAAKLSNLYGPTETTVDATSYVCEREGNGLTVPIGRPIANNRIYLLDNEGLMAPQGVPGEIYIGGAGVGRGYLDRAELTAAAFIPDSFSGERSERLYKTGDLGRYLPDGNVEFLGRVDHQVKLRGFRIEVGEIEGVLGQHPAVSSAAVLVKEDQHLVAYVVGDGEQGAPTSELRKFLQKKLPEHMVPSIFVTLQSLPLSPNGKIDRQALAALEKAEPESETDFVAPRTPIEEQLAAIWARRLKVRQVGINNDFFEMGGHSILASELMAEVRDTFEVALPLRTLFEKTTVAGLAQAIAQYKDQQGSAYVPVPVIVPAPDQRYEPFPLTDIQQAYWVGRSGAIELGNVSAHGYKEFDFIDLDVRRLELALQRLVERHDMLRAIITPDGQQQILKDVPPYEVKVLDLRERTPEVAGKELEAVREEMSHEVRSADQWPLFQVRASLLKNGRVRIHLSVDALIGDAWSWQLLGRELAQIYDDPAVALVPLELSFRDYILAVEDLRQSELYRRSRDYWFDRLATLPPAPDLPLATTARSIETPSFKRQTSNLEPEAWRRMKARGAQSGLTASGILLAAFSEVLAAWTRSPRFTINVTLFNRLPLHPQVNEILGDFTSVNLLAVDNSQPDTFENRARRIQERLWTDIDHRYLSGVEVLRELTRLQGGSPRGASMPIVFTSTLHHNADPQAAGVENKEQSDEKVFTLANPEDDGYGINQTPQVWLDHQVYETRGALYFNWDAVKELFPSGFLEEMFEAYCRLLEQLATDEALWEKPVRTLVSPQHLERVAAINATTVAVTKGLAHQFFISQVSQRPQHPAIIAGGRTLTYEEVYQRANQLGRRLRNAGARPNQLVAVVMEKGWEQVVAVLGILQSGAAYLPIDARFPQERICSLLENGEVTWVLTQSWIEQSLAWPANVERLCVDQQESGTDDEPLEPVQEPEDLAYVIYTSGSTGVPKGVMIEHRSVVNRITDVNQRFGIGPDDRAIALTALHHDLSVYDIFGVLGAGGTLVMPDAAATRDPSHWAELLVKHQVTLWNSVPAFMEMLVEHLESVPAGPEPSDVLHSLRWIVMSGDWIPVTLPERLRVFSNGSQIVSAGGPTETTVWDICYPIQTVDPEWKSIPYGRPMANARYYVLDEALNPRPTWVPGELYIGGAGLARGYWRDEEKTRSKFIYHPQLGERLYRSGDWGRYLPDGNIEFGGRADFQVKIQGYRVELGEIEAVLEQHPLIRSAVVTASKEQGKPRLVAYVVPKQEESTAVQSPSEDAIAYSLGRIDFKLKQLGLRHELNESSSISLVKPPVDEALTATYQRRQSFRKFSEEPISFEQLNQFLDNLLQLQVNELPLPKYRYPSAGNLYPVQTYLYVKPDRVEGVAAGVYYYHPREHCLVLLSSDVEIDRSIHGPINRPTFDESAFSIFLISQYDAITPLYGELARDFCTLEAGYMSQLLMMSAPDCGIGLCPVGNLDFEKIRQYFALQDSHVFTHSLLGGRLAPDQAQSWPAAAQTQSTAKPGNTIANELRDFLRSKLPEYMVPSTFIVLDTLPLTANGKVDRNLLPAPDSDPSERAVAHIKPRNAVEQTIAGIVQDLLNVKDVGINDSFFELGGNSVDMVRFHGKLRDTFNKDVSIVEMFANPTISSLVKLFSQDTEETPSFQHSHDRAESRRASRNQRRQSRQERR